MASVNEAGNSFLQAARDGDVVSLQILLNSGVDINYKGESTESRDKDWIRSPALVIASSHGHLAAVRLLLGQGADVDNKVEWSALLLAATQGHVKIVKLLIEAGAKSECEYIMGTTNPLPACADEQPFTEAHMEITRLLIRSHYDINSHDQNGYTALMNAVYRNNLGLFEVLIAEGANVNARTSSVNSKSVLDEAAHYGRLEMVKQLLGHGAEVKHDKRGYTPLHEATNFNKLDVINLLLKEGCEAEAAETARSTALHRAASCGAIESMKILLNAGFSTEATSSCESLTPLLEAAHGCRIGAVQLLLDAGANANAQDNKGWTALHHSTIFLHCDQSPIEGKTSYIRLNIMRLLLSRGADLTISDHTGATVLQKVVCSFQSPEPRFQETIKGALEAAPKGDIEAVKMLLRHGASIHHQDLQGGTVLHRAAHEWNIELMNVILSAGANIEAKKNDGGTPLFETIILVTGEHDNPPSVRRRFFSWVSLLAIETLLDAGADIDARQENGRTVLHQLVENLYDVEYGLDRKLLLLLLDRGASRSAVDSNGETAQHLAERLGKLDIAMLLRDSQ